MGAAWWPVLALWPTTSSVLVNVKALHAAASWPLQLISLGVAGVVVAFVLERFIRRAHDATTYATLSLFTVLIGAPVFALTFTMLPEFVGIIMNGEASLGLWEWLQGMLVFGTLGMLFGVSALPPGMLMGFVMVLLLQRLLAALDQGRPA
jgi:hypothetical protein